MKRGLLYFVIGAALVGAALFFSQPGFPRWLPALVGLPTVLAALILGAEALGSSPSPVHLGMFPLGVLTAALAISISEHSTTGIRVYAMFIVCYLISLAGVLVTQARARKEWAEQQRLLKFGDTSPTSLSGFIETM